MKALLERSTQSTNRKLRLQLFGEIYPQPRRHPNIIGAFDVVQGYINASTQYVPYLSFFFRWSNIRRFQSIFLNKREVIIFSLKKAGENGISIFKIGRKMRNV